MMNTQFLSVRFIKPDDCVEIGGNIGRNSCVKGKILKDSNNLLVIESDPLSVSKLEDNKIINSFSFKIEGAAISKVPLIHNEWNTKPIIDSLIPGEWKIINTITFEN